MCRLTVPPLVGQDLWNLLVSREIKRKSLTSAVTCTTDQVTTGISSCSNTRAVGPDKLSIFHLKHLGSRGIKYLTALFNDSVASCRFGSHPLSSQSRNQARTPLSALLIGLSLSSVQQRKLWRLSNFQPSTATCFHPQTNTVSDPDTTTPALLQLTSDIATGFNQRNPPHRTVCVAVDLTAEFDTVNYNVLLSKIVRSTEATCRWLSNKDADNQLLAAEVSSQRQL